MLTSIGNNYNSIENPHQPQAPSERKQVTLEWVRHKIEKITKETTKENVKNKLIKLNTRLLNLPAEEFNELTRSALTIASSESINQNVIDFQMKENFLVLQASKPDYDRLMKAKHCIEIGNFEEAYRLLNMITNNRWNSTIEKFLQMIPKEFKTETQIVEEIIDLRNMKNPVDFIKEQLSIWIDSPNELEEKRTCFGQMLMMQFSLEELKELKQQNECQRETTKIDTIVKELFEEVLDLKTDFDWMMSAKEWLRQEDLEQSLACTFQIRNPNFFAAAKYICEQIATIYRLQQKFEDADYVEQVKLLFDKKVGTLDN